MTKFFVGASDGRFAVVAVLLLVLHSYSCCSKAVLNNSSNSFSMNSGRVGQETCLVVGAHLSEINWSTLSSRKPSSSIISCVERFDLMVIVVVNDCEVTCVGIVVQVSVDTV